MTMECIRSAIAATLAGASLLSGSVSAATSDPPLLAAFKTFCMETQAVPDAVKAAVEAAGGVSPRPPAATDWPFHMTTQSWNLTLRGHRMMIGSGTMHTAASGRTPAMDSLDCDIHGGPDDEAGLAAVADWIGVPVSSRDGDELTYYEFVERDGRRVSVTEQDALRDLESGGFWTLVLIRFPSSASLQLVYSQESLDPR